MTNKLTLQDFQQFNEKVVSWNKLMGNIVLTDKSTPDSKKLTSRTNSKLRDLYLDLTKEEFSEYEKSIVDSNLVERVDALCDMIFTAFFAGEAAEYHTLVQPTLDGAIPQKLETIVKNFKAYLYSTTETNTRRCTVVKQLCMQVVYKHQDMFDIKGAFNRVLESNMTKATLITEGMDVTGTIALEKDYIEREGRYWDVWGDIVTHEGNNYIIMKAGKDLKAGATFEGGKVVKPTTYKSPEGLGGLGEFIYESL